MAKDALNNFANMLLKEASDQKKETVAKLEAERDRRLKEADERLSRRFDREVKAGIADMEQQMRLSLTRREIDLHKALLQNRQRTFENVFDAVIKNIRDFTQTPEYEGFLTKEFDQAAACFTAGSGELICTVMPGDKALAEKLFRHPDLTLQCAERDFIGGFTLESRRLHYFADCTLESRIEEQKQAFFANSGLIIE